VYAEINILFTILIQVVCKEVSITVKKYQKMELQNLPEHILVKVCRYSNLKSKLNLMLTSKFFNEFIGRNPEVCEYSYLVSMIGKL
jgi:hypothetical protein